MLVPVSHQELCQLFVSVVLYVNDGMQDNTIEEASKNLLFDLNLLSNWLAIGKGTADLLIQYAGEDMELVKAGTFSMELADGSNVKWQ